MKYFLIDTNVWIDLYLNAAQEKNLNQLLKWEKDGKIKFLLPETINDEFIRQKKIQLDILHKQIKDFSKMASEGTLKKLKEEFKLTENKIQKIEVALIKPQKIKISLKVFKNTGLRKSQNLAPFHNNQKSDNDAYLYFSSIEYLKKNKISSFVFITKNVKDFGDPDNSNHKIHPDLLIDGIEVQYFSIVPLAVNELQKELGGDANSNSSPDYTEIFHLFPDEENEKLIDQVYKVLDIYYEQLPFIPTNILARIFPFKILNIRHPEAYHSSFQLNINNDKLMSLLTSFSIGKMNSIHFKTNEFKGRETKAKEKMQTIIKKLNGNLIYDINGIGNNLKADIRLKITTECKCVRCSYNRFDFYNAFKLLDDTHQQKNSDTLKQAYMHYQFQRYDISLKLFFTVYENCVAKEQHILMIICLVNIKRLVRLISNYSESHDQTSKQIMEIVNGISVRQIRMTIPIKSSFVNEVIDWIADDTFHSQALEGITNSVEKIRDHYRIQLAGGSSSNSNFEVLISQFAELDSFVEENFMVYNNYLEFEKVTDKLLEGLFIIYSFNSRQSTRIEFINDYLLSRIIMFAKTENIIKYYKQYNLTTLKYRTAPKSSSELPSLAKTFFTSLENLYQLEEYKKPAKFFFFDKNRRILNNFLVILTVAKDTYDYDQIFATLFPVLKHTDLVMRNEVNAIADFISKKGTYISEGLLTKLIKFSVENKQMHEHAVFRALSAQLVQIKKNISITDASTFESIKINFLGTCPLCDHSHPDIAMNLFPLLSDGFKTELRQLILKSLDEQFNPDLYYRLAISGIIDYKTHLNQFQELCSRPLNKKDGPIHPFMRGEAILYRLSELLNIYFKNELSTKEEFFTKFKGFSDYYDWILNPDEFDYKKFNPLWILEYQTTYYLKRLFNSKNLKAHLLQFLKTKKHKVLNELFIEYY